MPPSTLIFGGSGKCARHITRLLAAEGHAVHSVIRNAAQQPEIESLGGRPIVQSIEDSTVDEMASTIRSTGASTVLCMDAAAAAGVRRYIIISAVDVRDRAARPEPEWYRDGDRQRSDRVWGAIGAYMEAKLAADRSLVSENGRRGLEYTIVRPVGLSEEPATGNVAAGRVHLDNTLSREDVASVVVQCIKQEGTKGLVFDVVGGETPIADAVSEVVKGKIDTFAGRY